MISIYKECTPCDKNGKVIAHVEPYKPISGQQTDGGHEVNTPNHLFALRLQYPAEPRFHFG